MTDWDGLLRRLVDPQPQDFVSWLLEGAKFVSVRERRMEGRVIEADLLYMEDAQRILGDMDKI